MSSETPEYNILTVAWINHRLQELAEEEGHSVQVQQNATSESGPSFWATLRANISSVCSMVMESVVKPVFAVHR